MAKVKLPPKPYPKFPLFAHRNGSWKKKIEGRAVSFGAWRWPDKDEYEQAWKAALEEYHSFVEAKAKGIVLEEKPEDVKLTFLIDSYLTGQEDRVGKEIEARTFVDRRIILTRFRKAIGGDRSIGWIEDRPELVVKYLGDLDVAYGFYRYNLHVRELKGAFNAAAHPITGTLKRPFRLLPLFKPKKDKVRRREKRERAEQFGKQRWTPSELKAFFDHAEQPLLSMIGLAYFAAFGNSDCGDVPKNVINFAPSKSLKLEKGWSIMDWQRPKNEIERAAVLPAFVTKGLIEAIRNRPAPAEQHDDRLVFLTRPHPFLKTVRGGRPYVREIIHRDAEGNIERTVIVDSVQKEFEKLRGRLSRCEKHGWLCKPIEVLGRGFRSDKKGKVPRKNTVDAYASCPTCGKKCEPMRKLGFYVFRHTATTYAIPAASLEARVLFEGHAIQGVRSHYVEELDTAELVKIARRLVAKLDEGATHSDESSSAA